MTLRVYIGFDEREAEAAMVARSSLLKVSGIEPEFLRADRLRDAGLLSRISDHRGQHYDLISNAPKSTEFAVSRFLTPLLCQSGFALFVDCDVVFLRDPREMLKGIKLDAAVSVVKHDYTPRAGMKMDGQVQSNYPGKNRSSVALYQCDHPANRRLSLHDINSRPGRDLHRFYWLHDAEIGTLDPAWNWLVNETDQPANLGIAHFTRGGPWLKDWTPMPHDEIWLQAAP
ncbi:MAG: glycosyltransferase [Planctomycetota bacterium]